MRMGHADAKIAAAAEEAGVELPAEIAQAPELRPDLFPTLSAFNLLSRARPVTGMGDYLPIPFEAVDRYAARFGPDDPEGFQEFLGFITALDEAWLAAMAEKRKK